MSLNTVGIHVLTLKTKNSDFIPEKKSTQEKLVSEYINRRYDLRVRI